MLAVREWRRFFRQRQRVMAALGQPILFWLLFGTGLQSSFRSGDQDFMTYYLPGTVGLILLFTSIFTTISIIEDRREGFLQGVLVAPVPRWTIVAGKIIGGALIAWVQAMLFLALAVAIGHVELSASLLAAGILMILAALALTAVGTFFAWPMESTQGFHAVMSLVLMPMWLLSGAFFPVPVAQTLLSGSWLMHWIMRCNPLTYTMAGLRHLLSDPSASIHVTNGSWLASLGTCWLATVAFVVLSFVAAWWVVVHRNASAS
ncbi:MAG: ABC transporter permease [Pirellulaceae bacterium]|nr:ABC transporter permease [Pirellulaceae bacterium]